MKKRENSLTEFVMCCNIKSLVFLYKMKMRLFILYKNIGGDLMDFIKRLPIYLILDCSSSMGGESTEAVKQAVKALIFELKSDPQTLEIAYLSVITFSSKAQQIIPLTKLTEFEQPKLTIGGTSCLGKALNLFIHCINIEKKQESKIQRGDWLPLAFLFSDGEATDDWKQAIKQLEGKNMATIIGCAVGANINTTLLKQISKYLMIMNTLSIGDFAQYIFFKSDIL